MTGARRREMAIAGHTGAPAAARAGLCDDDADVRACALGALERLGALTDDDVRTALADHAPAVRRRALEAAARRPPVGLLALLDDPDPSVIETAAWACGEQEDASPAVVAALAALAGEHADPLVREAAVAALGAIGSPDGLAAILGATRDRATVRRRAVLALAPFDGPAVDEALARARDDRDRQVRQAALDLLEG